MATRNRTEVTEFVLLGLSSRPEMQPVIFGVVLTMYLTAVLGNTLLVLVACSDPRLQTPMYFLLSQLSLIDISLTTITVPQMLVHTLSVNRTISYNRCMVQLFSFMAVGSMEGHLLAAMAYDRYVAICDPLRYSAIVSRNLCLRITLTSWAVVSLNSLLYSMLVTRLSFCGNQLTHFFCDITPLLKLSCTRPMVNEMLIFTEGVAVVVSPFFFIFGSYVRIGMAIAHTHSVAALSKALSTCGSHILVVLLLYGSVIHMYLKPTSTYDLDQDRQVAIFYTVVTPMLNPLIYSLRNQEVKGALRRLFRKLCISGTFQADSQANIERHIS
ncbi:olfactory receptor 1J21-like [Meriones unguiculatus]|uniref:olfactory receptor 1J21-like n=1 Tax=Meriones unguiculatus TaxID=10047 RepID=UPI000B4FD3B7|nr:olfactory receptor 50-like [Meriones unguiculatus]XP_060246569.1 olfactory receptor 1J21-like [Meriones unguiculatus]